MGWPTLTISVNWTTHFQSRDAACMINSFCLLLCAVWENAKHKFIFIYQVYRRVLSMLENVEMPLWFFDVYTLISKFSSLYMHRLEDGVRSALWLLCSLWELKFLMTLQGIATKLRPFRISAQYGQTLGLKTGSNYSKWLWRGRFLGYSICMMKVFWASQRRRNIGKIGGGAADRAGHMKTGSD